MAKALSRKVTIYINGKEVENTIKSLQAELRRLQNEQKKATIGSEEYLERGGEIARLKKYLQEHDATVQKMRMRLGDVLLVAAMLRLLYLGWRLWRRR